MESRGFLYCGLATTWNIILNAFSLDTFLWLEGRVRRGQFMNWAHRFRYRPTRFLRPETENELTQIVRNSRKIRVFGSGHSFNSAVVCEETLISLDRYSGLVDLDTDRKQATFRGGTRVRDVVRVLLKNGLAFQALPSHDAQSIGGILSSDVHGTGRDWGFVSEMVVKLKIVDGNGDVHVCVPTDPLFKAAIGGIGSVGIISEVTVQAVDAFNVEQRFELVDLKEVRTNLDSMLAKHDHLSLYIFPFATKCQISIWDRTPKPKSRFGPVREFVAISFDALISAWFGNLMAYSGLLERLSNWAYGLKQGTDLVLESNRAFNRTIYHLHQELEFTVPFEETWRVCDRFLREYEEMYRANPRSMPYALLEVRFTPAGHDRTFIGAGRQRRSAWVDLICNDSRGFEQYYEKAEEIIREIGARPHLGKYCRNLDAEHMRRVQGDSFSAFIDLAEKHDPERKFSNEFTARVLGR